MNGESIEFNIDKEQETYVHLKRIENNWGISILAKARINNFMDKLELAAGFDYTLPGVDVITRVEYYHHGPGVSSKDDYDALKVFNGELMLQGEDYIFLMLERVFLNYLTLTAGGMVNLNDLSAVIYPGISYELYSNFLVSFGGYIFTGKSDTEFGGEYYNTPFDLTEPALYIRMKLSF